MNPTVVIKLIDHQMPRQNDVTVSVSRAVAAPAVHATVTTPASIAGITHERRGRNRAEARPDILRLCSPPKSTRRVRPTRRPENASGTKDHSFQHDVAMSEVVVRPAVVADLPALAAVDDMLIDGSERWAELQDLLMGGWGLLAEDLTTQRCNQPDNDRGSVHLHQRVQAPDAGPAQTRELAGQRNARRSR